MKPINYLVALAVLCLGYTAQAYTNVDASRLDCRYGNIPGQTCSTDISWQTNRGNGVITVQVLGSDDSNERREKLFACGDSGVQEANWIRKNDDLYIFRLYEGIRCPNTTYPSQYGLGRVADQVEVQYEQDSGGYGDYSELDATRPRALGNGLFRTTLSWQKSAERGTGVITVFVPAEAGSQERLFACGDDGRQNADWIQTNKTYLFRLYEGKPCPNVEVPRPSQLGRETQRVNVRVR